MGLGEEFYLEEIKRLRDALAHATAFTFPGAVTVTRHASGRGWRIAWPDPEAPGDATRFHPMTEWEIDRDRALERTRELARRR